MATFTRKTYADIKNGDLVVIQGHLFEVTNLQSVRDCYPTAGCEGPIQERVTFAGVVADPTDDIKGTGYDGGTYAGWAWVSVSVAA